MNQIRTKLRIPAAAVQIPIGTEDEFKGVVDLVHWRAIYNEGVKGYLIFFFNVCSASIIISCRNDVVYSNDIPESVLELATEKRNELIEQLADVDHAIGDLILNDEMPNNNDISAAIRRCTLDLKFSPVFLGSAIKNTAIQPLLDGVCQYLPDPSETEVWAHDTKLQVTAPQVRLSPAAEAPMVGLAFKLEEGRFGQLTYIRMYQGSLRKGMQIYNARTGKKLKVPRLVRMHSNEMEVSSIKASLY